MLYALVSFLPVNTTVISVSRNLMLPGTGTAMPGVLRVLEHLGSVLDTRWRENITATWEELQKNNATLHSSLNGIIQASDVRMLDETIYQVLSRACISETDITEAVLIASGMQINHNWLSWRIRFLQSGMKSFWEPGG